MEESFIKKATDLFESVISDGRWDLNNETLFVAFGLTYYGYCFSYGKVICFLDPDYINSFVVDKLVGLGAGENYVKGLVDYAYSTFQQPTEGLYSQLVEIGHSHAFNENMKELINSIFTNATAISREGS